VAADAAAQGALVEMRGRLDAWMKRTGDPLLLGPIPAPAGALVNRSDDVEPADVWKTNPRPSAPT
jgi:hypothetical protein